MIYVAIGTAVFALSVLVFTIYLLIKIRQERMKQLKELEKYDENSYN